MAGAFVPALSAALRTPSPRRAAPAPHFTRAPHAMCQAVVGVTMALSGGVWYARARAAAATRGK